MSVLQSSAVLALLNRRNTPQQTEGEGSGNAERLQRSRSWAEVAAAFPVDSDAVRIEDIEVPLPVVPLLF